MTSKQVLIDWHSNVWLPEHLGDAQRLELASKTGRSVDASPEAHRRLVAAVADKFVCIAMKWTRLGVHIPNEFVADYVAQYPGRAVGFACVDPNDDHAPKEFEHAIGVLGLRGLKFSPVYAGFHPWCEKAWRLYEMANEFKVPILW